MAVESNGGYAGMMCCTDCGMCWDVPGKDADLATCPNCLVRLAVPAGARIHRGASPARQAFWCSALFLIGLWFMFG